MYCPICERRLCGTSEEPVSGPVCCSCTRGEWKVGDLVEVDFDKPFEGEKEKNNDPVQRQINGLRGTIKEVLGTHNDLGGFYDYLIDWDKSDSRSALYRSIADDDRAPLFWLRKVSK